MTPLSTYLERMEQIRLDNEEALEDEQENATIARLELIERICKGELLEVSK